MDTVGEEVATANEALTFVDKIKVRTEISQCRRFDLLLFDVLYIC